MSFPNTSRSGDFKTGTHDGTRMNTEFDRLYANDQALQNQTDNALGVNATTNTEVLQARNGQFSLLAEITILEAARAEIIAARSSASQGSYADLDARLEAIDTRITAVLSAVQGDAEVVEARTDAAGKVWAAIRDAINGGSKSLEGLSLQAIVSTVATSANIKAVYLYDTSKDSDGGAWRKRCQNLSWYNETLNTASRGKTREFPAMALIMAETAKITIYDATDPLLPMWMSFTPIDINHIPRATTMSALGAINGKMLTGSDYGLSVIDFTNDLGWVHTAGGKYILPGWKIASRATGGTLALETSSLAIVNSTINSIAATILPAAPIDFATGLPMPTVAIGTAGGVSVIKDNGAVVNSANTSSFSSIAMNSNRIWCNITPGSGYNPSYSNLPVSAGFTFTQVTSPASRIGSSTTESPTEYKNGRVYKGQSAGLAVLLENPSDMTKGMVNYTTKDYISGWMPGDIRGSWLADCLAGTIAGDNLITDGGFSSSSGWTLENGWSISGGVASKTAGASGGVYRTASVTVGKQYLVKFTISNYSAGTIKPFIGGGNYGSSRSSNGTYIELLTCATNTNCGLVADSSFVGSIDDLTIIAVDPDRSIKNKGLGIYGSLNKTAVATGADLVAYSGFSSLNYVEQPYNSDLDTAAGNFCYPVWVYIPSGSISAAQTIFRRGTTNTNDARYALQITTGKCAYFAVNDGTNNNTITSGALSTGWHLIFAIRNGTKLELWVDGGKAATDVSLTNGSAGFTNTSATLRIGIPHSGVEPCDTCSLTLLRFTAYAPTAEQISFIYNQERRLFEDNAKCLLGGTSNAVQAMAYDADIDLLRVATADGLSTFQGLRRVDYVQKPAGTSGSANVKAIAAARGGYLAGTAAEAYFSLPSSNQRELPIARTLPISAVKQTPTMTNSWTDYSGTDTTLAPLRYWKDAGGLVRLEGAVGGGTNGTSAFTLPPGYRPNAKRVFATYTNSGVGSVTIAADGTVSPTAGGTTWNTLDSIAFLAEQ